MKAHRLTITFRPLKCWLGEGATALLLALSVGCSGPAPQPTAVPQTTVPPVVQPSPERKSHAANDREPLAQDSSPVVIESPARRKHAKAVISAPVSEPSAKRSPAIVGLLATAEQATAIGQHERAMAILERGLKMAPRDHQLWYRLARARFLNGDYQQALSFAKRALSLTSSGGGQKSAVWRLVADIERARGNHSAAAQARERANAR